MIIQVDFGSAQTGVGYQFYDASGVIGSRVTSGITNPRTGVYVATATVESGAFGVYWDCNDANFTAVEQLRDALWMEAIAGYLDTEVAAIKAKTDNLPSDPADASDIATAFTGVNSKLDTIDDFLDTEVAAIKAKTDNLPADPADASDIATAFSTVNSTLGTIAGYIDTEVAAIKAKTDNLPSDPADASDIAASFSSLASTLATIATYIDTEVAAIKAKTDNLPASPAAVGSAMTLAADQSVNVTKINGATVNGTGITSDKWRGA